MHCFVLDIDKSHTMFSCMRNNKWLNQSYLNHDYLFMITRVSKKQEKLMSNGIFQNIEHICRKDLESIF